MEVISMNSETSDCKCPIVISLLFNDTAIQGVDVCIYAFIKVSHTKHNMMALIFIFPTFGSVHMVTKTNIMPLLQAAINGIAIELICGHAFFFSHQER